ncbi:hypothetical protein Ais01nite_72080 [Asanoa ishikariensis]|nr:hypothetical protein Ais01nite_72080 [Asanoa ishikariensis]
MLTRPADPEEDGAELELSASHGFRPFVAAEEGARDRGGTGGRARGYAVGRGKDQRRAKGQATVPARRGASDRGSRRFDRSRASGD